MPSRRSPNFISDRYGVPCREAIGDETVPLPMVQRVSGDSRLGWNSSSVDLSRHDEPFLQSCTIFVNFNYPAGRETSGKHGQGDVWRLDEISVSR